MAQLLPLCAKNFFCSLVIHAQPFEPLIEEVSQHSGLNSLLAKRYIFELNPLLPREYRIEQSTVDYHCRKAIDKINKVIKKGDEIKGSL